MTATVNALVKALEQRCPDDVVVEDALGSVTAFELLSAVAEVSEALSAAGIDRLGLLADNSVAWITVDLACQMAGICLLPLPVFFADSQLRHSVEVAGVDALLTDDPARAAAIMGATVAALRKPIAGLNFLQAIGTAGQERPKLPPNTRKITFTSGSTGTPRGVCLGLAQQLRVAEALDEALQLAAIRHLCLLPLSTLLENIGGVYYPLLTGGVIFNPPESVTGFARSAGLDMPSLLQAISSYQPTSIILLPQMLVGLVAALKDGWQAPPELQFAAVGGAKVAPELIECARQYGLPVYEGYGLSETASVACLNTPAHDRPGSVGRPLSHVELECDGGEIYVRGNSFLGYVGQPQSWSVTRVATGDLGHQDANGYVYLQGRRSNMLISGFGRNISPEWIESEMLSSALIEQCVVLGDARPYCTALVYSANAATGEAAIAAAIKSVNSRLPDYARVRRWHLLEARLSPADGLYTENGRPKRAAITARFSTTIESLYADDVDGDTSSVRPGDKNYRSQRFSEPGTTQS